jgi:chromosome segregation protein
MKLKQVKLSGFKSFCEETDLLFRENGITMIVGPNGCGKSNVVDAIRWALGEQSPRLLRGAAMGDVIFAGSTTRKPISRSEVSLLFDNSDGLSLEKFRDFSEISVTRRLYRNGESEYLINREPCRLLDVRELLMDTGAAGRSYSIVEQGRVEEFITATPQERRVFMEEAAGITLYKTRRIAAEKKLEQTRQNLLRVQDIVAELQRQESALREQMEKAKEFISLRDQAALYAEELARVRFERTAAACARFEAEQEKLRQDAQAAEQEQVRLSAEMETLTLEQTRTEGELRVRRESAQQKEKEITEAEKRLAVARQEQKNSRQWMDQLGQGLEELRVKLLAIAGLRMTHEGEREETARQSQALGAEIEIQEAAHADLQANHQARAGALKTLQEQLLECHSQITGIVNQTRFLNDRIAEDQRRRAALEAQVGTLREELEACRATVAARRARGEELRLALEAATAQSQALAQGAAAQAQAVEVHRKGEAAHDRQVMESRSRLSTLLDIQAGYQGYGEGVRAFMNDLAKSPERREELGVVGPLAELIQAPADLLEWAGGFLAPYLEVIVLRRAAALPAIEALLAGRKLGGLRFVALDVLPSAAGAPALGALGERLGMASELEGLRQALFGAVGLLPAGAPPQPPPDGAGHEWLAQDGRFHVDPKSVLTLGRSAAPAMGILRRREEIEHLQTHLGELERQQADLRAQGEALAAEAAALQAQRQQVDQRRAEDSQALKLAENEAAQAEREEKRLTQVQATQEGDLTRLLQEAERHRAELDGLAGTAQHWEAKRTELQASLGQVQDEAEQLRLAREQSAQLLTERKLEHGRLASQLVHLTARLSDLEVQAQEALGKQQTTQAELETHAVKLAEAEAEALNLTGQLTGHQHALSALREATRVLLQGYDGHDQHRTELVGRLKTVRQRLEQAHEQVHQVELKLTAEQMRRDQWAAQVPPGPARPPSPEPVDEKALEKRLNAAQAQLARIEGVNLGAPEEYETLTHRLGFLSTEKADLEKAVEDLEASIRKMNQESRRRFRETFDQVNEKFKELFPRVFGGGEASLVLTDSDDPLLAGVDIMAQPPGKKFQSLNLLSGGEKALTAISLIFSFFLIKPSPFCLLDEVDAPLDDANVVRFNRLIQSMTGHSQFIIITHNKRTMEIGDLLYGVTMEEAGVSKIVSVNLTGRA